MDPILLNFVAPASIGRSKIQQPEANFGTFLERLVGCIRLLRGINVVIRSWFDTLVKMETGPIVMKAELQQQSPKESRGECEALRTTLETADLSTSSMEVCLGSLNALQATSDNEHMLDQPSKSTHQMFAWLVTLSEPFTDLVDQRKPEALNLHITQSRFIEGGGLGLLVTQGVGCLVRSIRIWDEDGKLGLSGRRTSCKTLGTVVDSADQGSSQMIIWSMPAICKHGRNKFRPGRKISAEVHEHTAEPFAKEITCCERLFPLSDTSLWIQLPSGDHSLCKAE